MAEERKPINPLERRETIGIEDGESHDGEAVTPSRHGTGTDRGETTPAGPEGDPVRRAAALTGD